MPVNKKEALPTQQFIEIADIKDDVVVLKSGALRKILAVSGINLDLKSEDEKNLVLSSFQNFLNSLNFSVQIFVHSRKLNIDAYLETIAQRIPNETNELLKNQIIEYQTFVKALVTENAIMHKSYFVVVPYDPMHIGEMGRQVTKKFFGLLKRTPSTPSTEEEAHTEERFREHVEQLSQRVEQVSGHLNQIDLRAVPLNREELIELFYNLYNPGTVEKKELEIAKSNRE